MIEIHLVRILLHTLLQSVTGFVHAWLVNHDLENHDLATYGKTTKTRLITRLDCRMLLGRGSNQSVTDRPTDGSTNQPTNTVTYTGIGRVASNKNSIESDLNL